VSVYPQIPLGVVVLSHKNCVFSSSPLTLTYARKVVVNAPYELRDLVRDYTGSVAQYAIEVYGSVLHVEDVRHGRHWDYDDLTVFSNTATEPTEVLTIDYGAVVSAREVLVKVGYWCSAGRVWVRLETSEDGVTWSTLTEFTTTSTSEVIETHKFFDRTFRYLRALLWNSSGAYTNNFRLRKVIIIT
jgi:hypothetical protein